MSLAEALENAATALEQDADAIRPANGDPFQLLDALDDAAAVLAAIEADYSGGAESVDHTDGLSVSYADWRFNLRMSNTEPVIRLNVESRGDVGLMEEKTAELLGAIGGT